MNVDTAISTNGKVRLERREENPRAWKNPRSSTIILSQSLPYFRSSVGTYLHRVRSAMHYLWDGEYKHTALRFWCGMSGFAGSSKRHKGGGHFFAQAPSDSIICATCEGRAIGAGYAESHKINGRTVKYSPRS